jgi:hypothetical protein
MNEAPVAISDAAVVMKVLLFKPFVPVMSHPFVTILRLFSFAFITPELCFAGGQYVKSLLRKGDSPPLRPCRVGRGSRAKVLAADNRKTYQILRTVVAIERCTGVSASRGRCSRRTNRDIGAGNCWEASKLTTFRMGTSWLEEPSG